MYPTDASVYNDQWSATTWCLVLLTVVLGVIALMALFLAMVHRSTEQMTAHGRRVRAAAVPEVRTAPAAIDDAPAPVPEPAPAPVPAAGPARTTAA